MELPKSLKHDSIEHATEVLSQAFLMDAFQNYIVRTHMGVKNASEITIEQNTDLFSFMLRDFQQSGALFVTASDAPTVSSVWVPETPSRPHVDNGDTGTPNAVLELMTLAHPIWQREFPDGQKVLHLVLVGNASSGDRERGQKGASYVIREMLEAASKAGIPVVLEATSPKARDIYKRSGFKVVEEVCVGKGTASPEGRLVSDGVGFILTLMKYVGEGRCA